MHCISLCAIHYVAAGHITPPQGISRARRVRISSDLRILDDPARPWQRRDADYASAATLGPLAPIVSSQPNLCFGSQTNTRRRRSLKHMSAKYFTQFRLTDADYRGGNEFSGVVELSRPMDHDTDVTDIEAVLAKNFDLRRSSVQLVSWSRLH